MIPESNGKCPFRKHNRREDDVRADAETEVIGPQTQETNHHQKLEEARDRFLPRVSAESGALVNTFKCPASRTGR